MIELADLVAAMATESLESANPPAVLAERVSFADLTRKERAGSHTSGWRPW